VAKTKISKELQKIRIDHDLNRGKMARAIGISENQLTIIESGKVALDGVTINQIASKYFGEDCSGTKAAKVLIEAARDSVGSISFDMTKLTEEQRDMVFNLKLQLDLENAPVKRARVKRKEKAQIDSPVELEEPIGESQSVDINELVL